MIYGIDDPSVQIGNASTAMVDRWMFHCCRFPYQSRKDIASARGRLPYQTFSMYFYPSCPTTKYIYIYIHAVGTCFLPWQCVTLTINRRSNRFLFLAQFMHDRTSISHQHCNSQKMCSSHNICTNSQQTEGILGYDLGGISLLSHLLGWPRRCYNLPKQHWPIGSPLVQLVQVTHSRWQLRQCTRNHWRWHAKDLGVLPIDNHLGLSAITRGVETWWSMVRSWWNMKQIMLNHGET